MPKITAQIPEDIYRNINEEIKLGMFSNESEVVVVALKKAYARKSRPFLKWRTRIVFANKRNTEQK